MYCGELTAVKKEHDGLVAVSLPCNAWTCPDCAPKRKARLTAEAIGGRPHTFLTLTTRRRKDADPNVAALEMSRAWRLLRLRIMRKMKLARLPFLAVIEAHKSGWPHLHILLRAPFIPWKWLRAQWLDITGSTGVEIEAIKSKRKVAHYCAKYCSKCVHKFGTAKRYWQSRDYDIRDPYVSPDNEGTEEQWYIRVENIDRLVKQYEELGHLVNYTSNRTARIWFSG